METDDSLRALAAEIRALPHEDAAARRRVMQAVLREGGHRRSRAATGYPVQSGPGIFRLWNWLNHPRFVAVSPLGVAALAAVFLLLAFGWLRSPSAPAPRNEAPVAGQTPPGARWPTQFVVVAPGASRVALIGDFNNWDPHGTPLERSGREGVWTATLSLEAGVYSYSYLIDGRLEHAADEPGIRDEFGGGNSVVIVGEESS